jgi:hypothetical protein
MTDTLVSINAIVILFGCRLILALLIAFSADRIRNYRNRQRMAQASARHIARLGAPQFDAIASIFNCRLPDHILRLYENTAEAMREDFEIIRPDTKTPIYIAYYCPCDPETVTDRYPDCLGLLTIASDGGDLSYAVDPKLANPPVVEYDAETRIFTTVASTPAEFVDWPHAVKSYNGS